MTSIFNFRVCGSFSVAFPSNLLKQNLNKHTFINEHGVFTSPNANVLPAFPLQEMEEDRPDPKGTQMPMWSNNRWITLRFVPLRLHYKHPFDVLCPHHKSSFAIEKSKDNRWRMKPSVAQSWNKLQTNLLTFCMHISSNSTMLLPIDSQLFHLPDVYGYGSNHLYGSSNRA